MSWTAKPKENSEWAALGGLRFVLACIVFFTHARAFVVLPAPLAHIADMGAFAAVLGFFVVSGYSIAASLSREKAHFYERRLSRIYPIYFVCMVLSCVPFLMYGPVVQMAGGSVEAPKSVWPIIGNFFFLGGIGVSAMPTNAVVWSLVIEVVYYLFAPLFNAMRTRLLIALVAISCFAYWFHGAFGVPGFNTGLNGSYGAVALAWAWLFGFLIHRCFNNRLLLPCCLIIGCVLLGRFDEYGAARFSSAVFVTSVLVVGAAHGVLLPRRMGRILEYLGELSYPLYLCHFPILLMLYGGQTAVSWIAAVAAVLSGAIVLLHIVDFPYRAYARRRLQSWHHAESDLHKTPEKEVVTVS